MPFISVKVIFSPTLSGNRLEKTFTIETESYGACYEQLDRLIKNYRIDDELIEKQINHTTRSVDRYNLQNYDNYEYGEWR